MTDLENRLRSDLGELAERSDIKGDEAATLRAARRRKVLAVAGGSGGALLLVAASIAALTSINGPQGDSQPSDEGVDRGRQEMAIQERAEVFAIRALVHADLFDPRGYYYSFSEDVKKVDRSSWRIAFGASRCGWFTNKKGERFKTCKGLSGHDKLGNSKTDAWLTVTFSGDAWSVTKLEGNFVGKARQMLRFTLPDRNEIPHWEYPSVAFQVKGRNTAFEAADLWVGPIPYRGPGSYCRVIGQNEAGDVIYEGKPMYHNAPDSHWERAGGLMSSGFEGRAAEVTIECTRFEGDGWQPVSIELEVIGDEAVRVIAPLRFYGEHANSAAAECDAILYDADDQVLGNGFQQIRGAFTGPNEEPIYNLSFRIETDRPEDAVSADVTCNMA